MTLLNEYSQNSFRLKYFFDISKEMSKEVTVFTLLLIIVSLFYIRGTHLVFSPKKDTYIILSSAEQFKIEMRNTEEFPKCDQKSLIRDYFLNVIVNTTLGSQVLKSNNENEYFYNITSTVLDLNTEDISVIKSQIMIGDLFSCWIEEIRFGVGWHALFHDFDEPTLLVQTSSGGILVRNKYRENLVELWDLYLKGKCTKSSLLREWFPVIKKRAIESLERGAHQSAVLDIYMLCKRTKFFDEESPVCTFLRKLSLSSNTNEIEAIIRPLTVENIEGLDRFGTI